MLSPPKFKLLSRDIVTDALDERDAIMFEDWNGDKRRRALAHEGWNVKAGAVNVKAGAVAQAAGTVVGPDTQACRPRNGSHSKVVVQVKRASVNSGGSDAE